MPSNWKQKLNWKAGRGQGREKKKIESIWGGLGLITQRGRAKVGSGKDAKLLGKEWESQGNMA